MNVQQEQGFFVVGIAGRTNNADELSGTGKIGSIWETFLQQNLAAKIPNKIGLDLIAVYSDYESDHTGDYTYQLGVAVSSTDHLPEGLTIKYVPSGRYAMITSDRGSVTQVVPDLWRRIWLMPPAELGGTRAFLVDYEVYDQRAADPQRTEIDLYIGLR